jgi:hypothetical protein
LHLLRGIRRMPEKGGIHEQCTATTGVVYQLTFAGAKLRGSAHEAEPRRGGSSGLKRHMGLAPRNGNKCRVREPESIHYLLATLSFTELIGISMVPTLRDCSS